MDNNVVIQGLIIVMYEFGFYVLVWGLLVNGYVMVVGIVSVEFDLIVGYKKIFGGMIFGVGVLYYYYFKMKLVGDLILSDFVEFYLVILYIFGLVMVKGMVVWVLV